nr:carboxylesterase 1-like [Coffea arabica]
MEDFSHRCAGDPLIDRQIELVKKLEENGASVKGSSNDIPSSNPFTLTQKDIQKMCKSKNSTNTDDLNDDDMVHIPNLTYMLRTSNPCLIRSRNPLHLSKDISINQHNGTWARIYVPREAFDSSPDTKLPVIVYFHGGGFIVGNVSTPLFDDLHTELAIEIPAVIISVDYRLAPEHRLPAAYNDCLEALHTIKDSNDEWLEKYADLSKCFLMGTSAGGNIAYHGGLLAAACVDDLKPLEIKGLILHHPFFGGTRRTDSELRMANDKVIPLCATDFMWELSLPIARIETTSSAIR